ncbi:MlaE family lipid ABC transporter permease subunit [Pacificimonas sp. WHA3]|uniref:MlaE family lipid ABC transporter permease subunit n=1 Tax=Pacificimonas pallii TaxID=2827236 RepID=A0ABS6SIY8_9SPHN|nr:MlaE family lipid ABC transporter permease subunit [Pacificimonas pallii]MBV7257837.1 MlaE family lipid ABC transporter permease subunit [Pacificimonas pallii]
METATIHDERTEEGRRLTLHGRLTVRVIEDISPRLREMEDDPVPLTLDLGGMKRVDTTGAWVLYRLVEHRTEQGFITELTGLTPRIEALMAQVGKANQMTTIRHPIRKRHFHLLARIGAWVEGGIYQFGTFLAFLGLTMLALVRALMHPRRLRWLAILRQAEVVGVSALGIVGLMSFLVGIVIAQQGAVQLRQFGAEVFVINLVGRITFRELGVLMTAIMVAGRSGSAFAAQIGSMKLAEEVDAMRTIGMPPIEVLVIPRLIATTIAMPLLAFYGAIMAIVGGTLISWLQLGIPPAIFILRLQEVVPLTDVLVGLIKAPVFGIIIAVTGCFHGMQVEGSAEAVGEKTTAAVVQSIFLVIVLDAFFAIFFTALGWA